MTTISTVKKLAASAVIAGSLGLAGAVLTVAAPANAAPSSAAGTASSSEKWPGHANGSGGEESQRVGDATRASELRHDWDNQRGK